jgi:hypothetical protein
VATNSGESSSCRSFEGPTGDRRCVGGEAGRRWRRLGRGRQEGGGRDRRVAEEGEGRRRAELDDIARSLDGEEDTRSRSRERATGRTLGRSPDSICLS